MDTTLDCPHYLPQLKIKLAIHIWQLLEVCSMPHDPLFIDLDLTYLDSDRFRRYCPTTPTYISLSGSRSLRRILKVSLKLSHCLSSRCCQPSRSLPRARLALGYSGVALDDSEDDGLVP